MLTINQVCVKELPGNQKLPELHRDAVAVILVGCYLHGSGNPTTIDAIWFKEYLEDEVPSNLIDWGSAITLTAEIISSIDGKDTGADSAIKSVLGKTRGDLALKIYKEWAYQE